MNHTICVKMTEESLFDFLLYHTYSKISGFLVNVLGFAVFILGALQVALDKIPVYQFLFYFLASLLFLAYTPLQLKRRARKTMQADPDYRDDKHYTFSDKGIDVRNGRSITHYNWTQISHTVTTPKTIGFYHSSDEALIIPKNCFGNQFVPIMQMAIQRMGRTKVRLK